MKTAFTWKNVFYWISRENNPEWGYAPKLGVGSLNGMSRKPGRKPVFSEQDVIDAAFAIGIHKFTLSQVAERLGVAAAALYRLFDSRDAIVNACIKHAVAGLPDPEPGLDWRELLTSLAEVYWQLLEDYPGLEKVIYADPTAVAHFADFFRAWSQPLIAAGKTPGQAMFASDLIGTVAVNAHQTFRLFNEQKAEGGSGVDQLVDEVGTVPGAGPVEQWAQRGPFDLRTKFILNALEREWPDLAKI